MSSSPLAGIKKALSAFFGAIPDLMKRLIGSMRQGGSLRSGVPEQATRIVTVLVLGAAGVLSARTWLVPEKYKNVPLNQRWAVERERAKPTHYAGAPSCTECHDDQVSDKKDGQHRDLSCETCHGPSLGHVRDPENEDLFPFKPDKRDYCVHCHTYDAARPTGFPQINPASHNAPKPCISCHEPHEPEPPQTPKECGACHGEIDKTKAVSAHSELSCTTCHETTDDHKLEPHRVRPGKPQSRDFCAGCHDVSAEVNAQSKRAPRLKLATHGEKYQCWECHYPHMPEGR